MKKLLTVFTIFLISGFLFAQNTVLNAETYASYYAEGFHGRQTASGEIYDMNAYTAAHKTLPFGTIVEVTNLDNGKKVFVRINDRGPFVANREIDLSKRAAQVIGILDSGIGRVSLRLISGTTNNTPVPQPYSTQPKSAEVQPQPVQPQTQPYATQPVQPQAQPYATQPVQPQTQPYATQPVQPQTQPYATQPVQPQAQLYETQPVQPQYGYGYTNAPQLVYTPTTPAQTPGVILWRIQLGAFAREENALRLVTQLRKINFEPAYEKSEGKIRVVLYGIRENDLERVQKVLKDNNFTDYVIRQETW